MTVGTAGPQAGAVSRAWRRRFAWLVAGASIGAAVASLPFIYANGLLGAALLSDHLLTPLVTAVVFATVGGVVAASGRAGMVGWLCLAVAVCQAVSLLAAQVGRYGVLTNPAAVPGAAVLVWIDSWLWFVGIGLAITVLVNVFPGTPLTAFRRVLAGLGVVGIVAFSIGAAVTAWPRRGRSLLAAAPATDFGVLEVVGLAMVLGAALGSALLLVQRVRRSTGRERHQLQLVALAGAATVLILTLGTLALDSLGAVAELVALPLIPTTIGISIVRRHLYDVEVILRRSVIYAVLTVMVGTAYGIAVAATGLALGADGHVVGVVAASALVAVGFGAVRTRVEQVVERHVFGLRRDPAAALGVLADRLAAVGDLQHVASGVVQAIAGALKLSYVKLELEGPASPSVVAVGREPSTTAAVPLVDRGQPVGQLTIGTRDRRIDSETKLAVGQLAAPIAASVHAAQLAEELQQARERLVSALEEERRRLRRDLHDGMGPALAGILFQLEALGNVIDSGPAASTLLDDLRREVRTLVDDTRRIVQGLRPPALDEYGLAEALHRHAARLSPEVGGGGTVVRVEGPEDLGKLPAAVEVAAFRIVSEAMTNVVRHARANHCTVRLVRNDELCIEVVDDGVGIDTSRASGVGLRSMHERAAEVGGWLRISPGVDRGTTVVAALPLEAR